MVITLLRFFFRQSYFQIQLFRKKFILYYTFYIYFQRFTLVSNLFFSLNRITIYDYRYHHYGTFPILHMPYNINVLADNFKEVLSTKKEINRGNKWILSKDWWGEGKFERLWNLIDLSIFTSFAFLFLFFFFFFLHLYSLSTSLPILLPSFIRLSGHKFTVSITADRNNAGLFRPLRIVACSTFKVLKNQFFFSIGENAVKNTGGGGASGVAGNKTARTTTGREEGKKKREERLRSRAEKSY